jgi:aminocarboxymuconate-semialdehyde decarboxylase
VIDVHAHYVAPSLLERASRPDGIAGVTYDPDSRRVHLAGAGSRPVPPPLKDLAARRTWNAARGLELQVLSPWMDLIGDELPAAAGETWTRALNDTVAEDIAGDAGFTAFAALPRAGEAAARELERCMRELGFAGAALPTQLGDADLDQCGLEPLFEAAQALDAPLFLHPFRVMGGDRMKRHFLENVCGNPFETTQAAVTLFFSGVFDRWPGLRILLSHCGGTLPLVAGRVAHASVHGAPGVPVRMQGPDELLERYFYDTLLHDPAALAFAIARVGAERVALGTDVPFPMQTDQPAEHLRQALKLAGLGDECFDQVTRETPMTVLGHHHARAAA